jgi:hypothetical protein
MAQLNVITLSHPTYVGPSGATAAATYSFFSKDYKPPAQPRAVETDVVINQNGKFKYVYDNGPGFRQWQPFSVKCEDSFRDHLGVDAATQYAPPPGTVGVSGSLRDACARGTVSRSLVRPLRTEFPCLPTSGRRSGGVRRQYPS